MIALWRRWPDRDWVEVGGRGHQAAFSGAAIDGLGIGGVVASFGACRDGLQGYIKDVMLPTRAKIGEGASDGEG